MTDDTHPPAWQLWIAFAALYIIWGSTYLSIKIAIETMPPFLMATTRFLLAGAILYAYARLKGEAQPTKKHWIHASIVGSLLIAGGNGIVTFSEQWIDSSMAALIIASNPLFMTLLSWWGGVQSKPTLRIVASLLGGFAGVVLLMASSKDIAIGNSFIGYVLILLAVLFWTLGSVYSKRNPQQINPWLQSGMQMLCGSVACLIAGALLGEFKSLNVEGISMRSWTAFGYLTLMGSLAGFTSYVFLLRHCAPSAVSSHAYVNPAVALVLGWVVLGETLTPGGFVGSGLVLVSVYALLRQGRS